MNKIAQRRNILNKIKEKIYEPGENIVSKFSPEFSMLMDTLRQVDDEVREIAIDLKDMLKVAKSNLNRREYMTAIAYLGRFHERTELVKTTFTKLNREVNSIHNEFLFGDLDPEHRKYLFDQMPEKLKAKPKAAPAKADDGKLGKEAALKDKWKDLTGDDNLASERTKALKIWEKRFPKASKEIKQQTERMLTRSEMFLNFLLNVLKQLASYRATRKVEDYLRLAAGYSTKFDAYDASFNDYYNGSVKKFIDAQKEYEAAKMKAGPVDTSAPVAVEPIVAPAPPVISLEKPEPGKAPSDPKIEEGISELAGGNSNTPRSWPKIEPESTKQVIVNDPTAQPLTRTIPSGPLPGPSSLPIDLINRKIPGPAKMPTNIHPPSPLGFEPMLSKVPAPITPVPPAQNKPVFNSEPSDPDYPEPEELNLTPSELNRRLKAEEFVSKITKISNKNPVVLATEIFKFAKSIESSDKETSVRLISIAKTLVK